MTKLNADIVRAMRLAYDTGCYSYGDLAAIHGVSVPHVSQIIKGHAWTKDAPAALTVGGAVAWRSGTSPRSCPSPSPLSTAVSPSCLEATEMVISNLPLGPSTCSTHDPAPDWYSSTTLTGSWRRYDRKASGSVDDVDSGICTGLRLASTSARTDQPSCSARSSHSSCSLSPLRSARTR